MKDLLRSLTPKSVLEGYRRFRRYLKEFGNRGKSVEEVFTRIYARNDWGGRPGQFCSGNGSGDERVVSAYVEAITALASREGFAGSAFVDLGCGDFRVGRRLLPLASRYIGIDVVKALVAHNQREFGDEKVRFESLDLVQDPLPPGDVCFIRQVLQHLSNEQVEAILRKVGRYRWVLITEHYPPDGVAIIRNLDKVHGSGIRFYSNSGVYLTDPPISLPAAAVELVLEVVLPKNDDGTEAGVIRTFLYRPKAPGA